MASFHPKAEFRRKRSDTIWARAANHHEFSEPRVLWRELWPKFNRVTIPLLDENAFFADAVSIAKIARDREELEDILAERRDERVKELDDVLTEISLALLRHTHKLEFDVAEKAASKVVKTNSFDSMLQFISGSMFGWPDEPADQRKPRPRVPIEMEPDPPIPSFEDLDSMTFTQWDEDASWGSSALLSSREPSPVPSTSPEEDEEMRSKPPGFSTCDNDIPGAVPAPSTVEDSAVPHQQPHLPSSPTHMPPTAFDSEISKDVRASYPFPKSKSPHPNPYTTDPQSLPVEDNSPKTGGGGDSCSAKYQVEKDWADGPRIAAPASSRKRRHSASDSTCDSEDNDQGHKRRKDNLRPAPDDSPDAAVIGSCSAASVAPFGSTTCSGSTIASSASVGDDDKCSDQSQTAIRDEGVG